MNSLRPDGMRVSLFDEARMKNGIDVGAEKKAESARIDASIGLQGLVDKAEKNGGTWSSGEGGNKEDNEEQQPSSQKQIDGFKAYILGDYYSQKIDEKAFDEAISDFSNGDSQVKERINGAICYASTKSIDVTNMSPEGVAQKEKFVKSQWSVAFNIINATGNSELIKAFSEKAQLGYYSEKKGRQYLSYPIISKQGVSSAIMTKNRIVRRATDAGAKSIYITFAMNSQTFIFFKPPRA